MTSSTAETRVILVDLNNYARFPTMAIGILVASLRAAGISAEVVSPLALDVPAFQREGQESKLRRLGRTVNHVTVPWLAGAKDAARSLRKKWINRPNAKILDAVRNSIAEKKPDIVLLSAYLQHRDHVTAISKIAQERGIPVILGGPMFNLEVVADSWRTIPGLTAIFGGEAEYDLPEIVRTAIARGNLLKFHGIVLPNGERSTSPPPFRDMDSIPIPDYTDFPWERYPVRVVPVLTGRGCQWAKCKFCSDILTASGRTYRTRSIETVLRELEIQSERHNTGNFIFLDLKLNSVPGMLAGITQNIQTRVPGAQWIGQVHVDLRKSNGLSASDLTAASEAGMRRISFGFESGSQRLLDSMDKGSTVERNSQFVREAFDAGLSLRCTMFKGYPDETADDLKRTADFLEEHSDKLDRVNYNDFTLTMTTPIYDEVSRLPERYPTFRFNRGDNSNGYATYRSLKGNDPEYVKANARVLAVVNMINARPLREQARFLDGLM
jgi:anaerobic magnesium-protoporphyrin IX monomethyl ester cyclase